MVAQAFNSSTQEAETGRSPGHPDLRIEFKDSQGYTEKPCSKRGMGEGKDLSALTAVWRVSTQRVVQLSPTYRGPQLWLPNILGLAGV